MPIASNVATIAGTPASFKDPTKRNIAAVATWTIQSAIVPARERELDAASTGQSAVRTDGVLMTVSFSVAMDCAYMNQDTKNSWAAMLNLRDQGCQLAAFFFG